MIGKEFNLKDINDSPGDFEELLKSPGYLIYRIRNEINGKSYIGDTKLNLHSRLFHSAFGNGHLQLYKDDECKVHLYNAMRKHGLNNFYISILSTNPICTEESFIIEFDSYENGYNRSKTGLGNLGSYGEKLKGKIPINNVTSYKYIKPKDLDFWINKGWIKGFGNLGGHSKVARDLAEVNKKFNKTGFNDIEARNKGNQTRKLNNSSIYSKESEISRTKTRVSNAIKYSEYIISYLTTLRVEINKINFNKNRYIAKELHPEISMVRIPTYDTYLRYKKQSDVEKEELETSHVTFKT